jgi:hypothetical protein
MVVSPRLDRVGFCLGVAWLVDLAQRNVVDPAREQHVARDVIRRRSTAMSSYVTLIAGDEQTNARQLHAYLETWLSL